MLCLIRLLLLAVVFWLEHNGNCECECSTLKYLTALESECEKAKVNRK